MTKKGIQVIASSLQKLFQPDKPTAYLSGPNFLYFLKLKENEQKLHSQGKK